MPPKSRDTRIEAKKSEAPKEIKKATTQIQKLFDLNGKLLGELLASLSVAKGTGDGLKKNEIEMLNALNNNVVKVQKYIDESQETKDESLRAQSKSIRIRREEVLAKRKKKSQK